MVEVSMMPTYKIELGETEAKHVQKILAAFVEGDMESITDLEEVLETARKLAVELAIIK